MLIRKELPLCRTYLEGVLIAVGKDFQLLISGGESPHIGCTVLAVPRESLNGSGKMSSTSSVLNITAHKDEELCRYLAERIAAKTGRVAACSGGIHVDRITEAQIQEIREAVVQIGEEFSNML